MAKKTHTITTTSEGLQNLADYLLKPEYDIRSAVLKDGCCNYSYELTAGKSSGDIISRNGANLYHNDLQLAFDKLKIHMAFADDIFKHNDYEFEKIEDVEGHELTELYSVFGFKLNSSSDKVMLTGSKTVQLGHIDLNTPRISMINMALSGGYKHADSLAFLIKDLQAEVLAYMNGKFMPKEKQPEFPGFEGKDEFNQEEAI